MRFLLDRLITVLLRVQHALKMGLLVAGVAVGTAALWYVVNAPDHATGKALAERLAEAPVPITALAPQGWRSVCLVNAADDPRPLVAPLRDGGLNGCEGWARSHVIYDGWGWIAYLAPKACTVTPVHEALFAPAPPGRSACHRRAGLMQFTLQGRDGEVPVLAIETR